MKADAGEHVERTVVDPQLPRGVAVHWPRRTLWIAGGATLLLAVLVAAMLVSMRQQFVAGQERQVRIAGVTGQITHLDELLTMSARMAAATGDPRWQARYLRHLGPLDTALAQLNMLSPAVSPLDATAPLGEQTQEANDRLVEIETLAFEHVNRGELDAARDLLFSGEYEAHKRLYAQGTANADAVLQARLAADADSISTRTTLLGVVCMVGLGILAVGWVRVARIVKRYCLRHEQITREAQTEREQAQQASAELRKLSLVAAKTDNAVVITDAQGLIEWVNEGFTRLTKYSLDEVIGKKPGSLLQGPDTDPDTVDHLRQCIRDAKPAEVEIVNYSKDGAPYWIYAHIQPVRDDGGTLRHFIAIERDITARKLMEQQLESERSLLENLIESVPDLIYYKDRDGKYLGCNGAFARFVGIPKQDIIASTDYDLFDEVVAKGLRSADEHVMEHGLTSDEQWVQYPDGRRVLLDTIKTPLLTRRADAATPPLEGLGEATPRRDREGLCDTACVGRDPAAPPTHGGEGRVIGLLGISRDITQRHHAIEALAASERKYQRISANVPGMVYQFNLTPDGVGTFPFLSDGVRDIYGLEAGDVVRDPSLLLDAVPTEDRERFYGSIAQSAATLDPWRFEGGAIHTGGERRWVKACSRPERQPDGSVLWDGMVMDITQLKEAQVALEAARQQAEAANRAKSAFLANMSHEIRTPLAAIIGFSDLACQDDAPSRDDLRDWLRTIRHSGQHLLSLINDVLDLSKIEAGRMEYESIETSPHRILSEVLSTLRVPASQRSLDLDLSYDSPLPQTITTDPTRLRQVVTNLLSNAIKFTKTGGVTLRARYTPDAHGTRSMGALIVDVIDSGIGVPPDKLDAIFEAFTQADNSITRQYGGTGLGLAISRQICRDLGGDLTATSTPGQGSTFTLWIDPGHTGPLLQDAPPASEALLNPNPPPPPPHAQHTCSQGSSTPARLLLTDDGPTNRKLISLLLTRAGHLVDTADDGQQALDRAAQAEHEGNPYRLLLMDMQMPLLDGYAAAAALRARGFTQPIIAITAHAMKGAREECLDAGCSDYLSKPIDAAKLIALVAHLLSEHTQSNDHMKHAAQANAQAPDSQASTDMPDTINATDTPPLLSTLPLDDEDFLEIIHMFVDGLAPKLDAMTQAVLNQDAQSLADLAHWLKGSGGTAGFTAFTQPASQLEQHARAQAFRDAEQLLEAITLLAQRAHAGLTPTPKPLAA